MVAALSGLTLGLVLAGAAAPRAEASEPIDFEVEVVSSTGATVATAVAAPRQSTVVLRGRDETQLARAFTLKPGLALDSSSTFRPQPSAAVDEPPEAVQQARWLASQYLDIDNRLYKDKAATILDQDAESAAYQLAVWDLLGRADLDTAPQSPIVKRGKYLSALAGQQVVGDVASPVAGGSLTLTREIRYLTGERLRATLLDNSSSTRPLSNQLVTLYAGTRAIRVLMTDAYGNATTDLSNDLANLGTVTASWSRSFGPGSVVSSDSEDLILFESVPIHLTSNPHEHVAPTEVEIKEITVELALRWLTTSKYGTFLGFFVALLLLFGIPGLVAKRVDNLKKTAFLLTMALDVAIMLVIATALARQQDKEFDPRWSATAAATSSAESVSLRPVDAAVSSQRKSNRYDNAYAGACAVDGSATSAWISHRNLGPLELLAIRYPESALVTSLDIIPGWLDTRRNYDAIGRPARLQVFGDTGQVAEFDLPHRDWATRDSEIGVDLSSSPIRTQTLYVRVLRIEGDRKTDAAIAEISARGSRSDSELAPTIRNDHITEVFNLQVSDHCDFA